jgi:hypothetical protein
MQNPDVGKIHEFWYQRPVVEWFLTPKGLDEACKDQFVHLLEDARADKLDHWQQDRDGTLALLILLDQFSRNVYRGTPDAFSSDSKALDIAVRAIAKGWDKNTTYPEALTIVSNCDGPNNVRLTQCSICLSCIRRACLLKLLSNRYLSSRGASCRQTLRNESSLKVP